MNKEIIKDPVLGDEYSLYTHPSGLKIYLMKKSGFSTYSALFGTAYGSVDIRFSRDGGEMLTVPEGIAHFLEHKLFESEELDAFELFSKTGAYANAYTSFDRTCYLFKCSDNFYENLEILLNFVQSPYFTAETVRKEQGIIGQEITMYEDEPDWRVMFNFFKALYHNHPIRVEIAGTRDSIAKIDDKLLYECYNTFYDPSNMFICIAGDFSEEKVLSVINDNLKPRDGVTFTRGSHDEPDGIVQPYIEQTLAVSMPLFMFGYKDNAVKEGYASEKRCVAFDVLLDCIAGEISPLYERLMEKGYINEKFEGEYFSSRDCNSVVISGESENYEEIFSEFKKEVKRIKAEGLDPELFELVKRHMYGRKVAEFDGVDSCASMLVSAAVCSVGLFDDIAALRELELSDVIPLLDVLQEENCALSVIKPNTANRKD